MTRARFPLIAAILAFALACGTTLWAECTADCSGAATRDDPADPSNPPEPPTPPIGQHDGADRQLPLPERGDAEYILTGRRDQVARAGTLAERLGMAPRRHQKLNALGLEMLVIAPQGHSPAGLRTALARARVRVTFDRNSTYHAAGAETAYAGAMVGLDVSPACALARPVSVGLLDGPVDTAIPALKDVTVSTFSALALGEVPGSANHATGLASLIAGHDRATGFDGLARGARILSAVAFARDDGQDLARTDAVVAGLDWLVGKGAGVINLSLTGPRNDTLAYVLALVAQQGPILVAAAGNEGRGDVSFPAADPNVLSLTALDARKHLYRNANYGEQVDFAAPGVDVLVAEPGGLAHRSGTSYATAVATAVIAHDLADGTTGPQAVTGRLRRDAEDLGQTGHDPYFGWGLMRFAGCANLH